jgi:hypothetical protein
LPKPTNQRVYTKRVAEWVGVIEKIERREPESEAYFPLLDRIDEECAGKPYDERVTIDLSGSDMRVERWMDLAP